MKILVFSDSHRDVESMSLVTKKEKPETIIHLGDNAGDAQLLQEQFPKIKIEYIRGNTDFAEDCLSENHLLLQNKLIFITHGHKYNVKWSKKEIKQKGLEDNADIVLFGHTHEPYLKIYKGMWVMNPGSIGRKFIRKTSNTYGIIKITAESIRCRLRKFVIS